MKVNRDGGVSALSFSEAFSLLEKKSLHEDDGLRDFVKLFNFIWVSVFL